MNVDMDMDMNMDMDLDIRMQRFLKMKKSPESVARKSSVLVPDRRRRILLKVVLVRRWVIWVLGIWRGVRKGRSVYKQPETEADGSCYS